MDVVYLCRHGDNPELMYSLRSLTNIPHDRVWIFGGAPHWVKGVTVIDIPEQGNKHRHTNITMRAACEHPDVSDPFIYMNDDFYITRPITEIPTLNYGKVRQVIDAYHDQGFFTSRYVVGMEATLQALEANGYPDPLSFELHVPMVIHKQAMLHALDLGPYQRRTVYGALAGLTGTTTRDVKLTSTRQPLPDGPFMSTSDTSFRGARATLRKLFPTKSPYER